jgi:hypothetical protein
VQLSVLTGPGGFSLVRAGEPGGAGGFSPVLSAMSLNQVESVSNDLAVLIRSATRAIVSVIAKHLPRDRRGMPGTRWRVEDRLRTELFRNRRPGSRQVDTLRSVIVLDTNILRAMPRDGAQIAVLRAFKKGLCQRLVLPVLVFEEFNAHHRRTVDQKVQQVRDAHEALNALDPDWPLQMPSFPSLGAATTARMQELAATFDIIDLPEHAATKALVREAQRLPPASTVEDKPGSGARDVAIWLTVLDEARKNPEDVIYLVSNDEKAFGKNKQLLPALRTEVKETGGKVIYCSNIAQLVDELATQTEVAEDVVTAHLTSPVSAAIIADWAVHSRMVRRIHVRTTSGIPATAAGMVSKPDVELAAVTGAEAYEIGGETWVSVKADWRLNAEVRFTNDLASVTLLACTWPTRVLLKMDEPPTPLDVVNWGSPRDVTLMEDDDEFADDEDDFEDHGIDDDSGYGPSSYFAHAMSKND